MKSTSADAVIIQALCPGPGDTRVFGAPLVMYASRSAIRAASSAGLGVADVGGADAASPSARAAAVARSVADVRPMPIARRPGRRIGLRLMRDQLFRRRVVVHEFSLFRCILVGSLMVRRKDHAGSPR